MAWLAPVRGDPALERTAPMHRGRIASHVVHEESVAPAIIVAVHGRKLRGVGAEGRELKHLRTPFALVPERLVRLQIVHQDSALIDPTDGANDAPAIA